MPFPQFLYIFGYHGIYHEKSDLYIFHCFHMLMKGKKIKRRAVKISWKQKWRFANFVNLEKVEKEGWKTSLNGERRLEKVDNWQKKRSGSLYIWVDSVHTQTYIPEYPTLDKAIRNRTEISRIVAILFVITLYQNMTLWNL